jgi:hypothetical protein
MKYTSAVLHENAIEEVFFTMVSIKFGLWDVTVCGLVDGCQYSMFGGTSCLRKAGRTQDQGCT